MLRIIRIADINGDDQFIARYGQKLLRCVDAQPKTGGGSDGTEQ